MTDVELIGKEFELDGVTYVVRSVTPDVAKCSVKGAKGRPKGINRQRVELLVKHLPVLEQVELPLEAVLPAATDLADLSVLIVE